eukprot:CAMPEP_0117773884 /NCGR_PEP_ID=MMETSP0947-20121206/26149_1 /TAXON_ID=44440 /ORGANISM="Chattonella subsalsa, Strain CCMP2191" /LENGTH=47 /DNA_ID= /DNA_START= /DNA_END= /DNA_ORIENTATION=
MAQNGIPLAALMLLIHLFFTFVLLTLAKTMHSMLMKGFKEKAEGKSK